MTEPTRIIVPRKWKTFQHVDATKRGRNPKWIKNYTALMSDDDYLDLTGHRRAILHGIWLEYARSGCRLRLDTLSITRRLNLRVTSADLKALNQAGFLDFCPDERPDKVLTPSSLDKRREEKTKAVLTALPGGGQPDDADSLGNTFENILKEIV